MKPKITARYVAQIQMNYHENNAVDAMGFFAKAMSEATYSPKQVRFILACIMWCKRIAD